MFIHATPGPGSQLLAPADQVDLECRKVMSSENYRPRLETASPLADIRRQCERIYLADRVAFQLCKLMPHGESPDV